MTEVVTIADPAEARKRRKAIITSQRQENEVNNNVNEQAAAAPVALDSTTPALTSEGAESDKVGTKNGLTANTGKANAAAAATATIADLAKPVVAAAAAPVGGARTASKRKIRSSSDNETVKKKTQIRYDPEVPMTKEQLASWRREARRVRNRESAAASRQRIRSRITELECEVDGWKKKYNEAMGRLQVLEQIKAAQASSAIDQSSKPSGEADN